MNSRSIRNKFLELLTYVSIEKPDVILVTETWTKFSKQINKKLSERDSLSEYLIEGYILFYNERLEVEGGGLFTYVKDNLKPVEITLNPKLNVYGLN